MLLLLSVHLLFPAHEYKIEMGEARCVLAALAEAARICEEQEVSRAGGGAWRGCACLQHCRMLHSCPSNCWTHLSTH